MKEVRLTRWFLAVTLTLTALLTSLMAWISATELKNEIIERSEAYAVLIARNLHTRLAERNESPLTATGRESDLDDPEVYARLRKQVEVDISGLMIIDVVIYDAEGRVLFALGSSESRGEQEDDNPYLQRALEGEVVSHLLEPGTEAHEPGPERDMPLLETYVPIHANGSSEGPPIGVMETYQDATIPVQQYTEEYVNVGLEFLLVLIVLAAAHFFIVRSADKTIRRRTAELERKHEDLEALKDELEERVETRSKQLAQAEKLAGLGRVAAGIAHELNTPLASISTCSEGLLRRLEQDADGPPPELQEYLEVIRDEAFRCKAITEGVLGLSRADRYQSEPVDAWEALERTLQIFAHQLPDEVTLETRPPSERPWLVGDPARLQQLFLNVTKNAVDACEGGGRVVWEGEVAEDVLELRCRDDGAGIADEDLSALWDPFFTTKEPGRGTGLGLALCHRIVQAHGGRIRIDSSGPGSGTVVTIRLPLSTAELQQKKEPSNA